MYSLYNYIVCTKFWVTLESSRQPLPPLHVVMGVWFDTWQICVVHAILKDDVITIAPMGPRKSMTYWMPELFIKCGINVIVTPLKLCRAQFSEMLEGVGISAVSIISEWIIWCKWFKSSTFNYVLTTNEGPSLLPDHPGQSRNPQKWQPFWRFMRLTSSRKEVAHFIEITLKLGWSIIFFYRNPQSKYISEQPHSHSPTSTKWWEIYICKKTACPYFGYWLTIQTFPFTFTWCIITSTHCMTSPLLSGNT